MRPVRSAAAALAAAALAVTGLAAAAAPAHSAPDRSSGPGDGGGYGGGYEQGRPFPDRIELPDGFAPEGITSGRGTTFFVGSLADGAVYRGDLRTGRGSVLVEGEEGAVAVGLDYDRRRDRVWVAGQTTGTVTAYDARTGRQVYQDTVDAGFLNDVAVTRDAVYVTDSQQADLVVVPLDRRGRPGEAFEVPITGDLEYVDGFNANGIVPVEGGRAVVVVQSATGELFRVDPATGVSEQLDVRGRDLTGGDGLERVGRTLYVVRGGGQAQVDVVRLDRGYGRVTGGRVVGAITEDEALDDLDVPTTATFAAGRLFAVNARFGTPVTPDTDYWVTQLPARP